jgi:hypothetical protein
MPWADQPREGCGVSEHHCSLGCNGVVRIRLIDTLGLAPPVGGLGGGVEWARPSAGSVCRPRSHSSFGTKEE